jgi:hypothetical protein
MTSAVVTTDNKDYNDVYVFLHTPENVTKKAIKAYKNLSIAEIFFLY